MSSINLIQKRFCSIKKKLDCFRPKNQKDEPVHQDHSTQNDVQEEMPVHTTAVSEIEEESAVPEGFMEIYVKDGEERRRYLVPFRYLSYPEFDTLLKECEVENETENTIEISCPVKYFERKLDSVEYREREAKCLEKSFDERLWKSMSSSEIAKTFGVNRMRYSIGASVKPLMPS